MKTKINIHFLLLLTMLSAPNLAHAQGTAFAYRGQLEEGGLPANGNYDFVFTVHDAAVDGNALGQPVRLDAITVSAGQFVVPLDFGAGVFTGGARWLQISVRRAGAGAHTVLEPRQTLLPTPYAIHAGSAGTVASGTVTPTQLNTGGVAPVPGQFLSYNGGNLFWSDPAIGGSSVFSLNGTNAYYTAGNLGIGTNAPTAGYRLEIDGATILRPGNGSIQFGSPNAELGMSITPTLGDGNSRADLRFNGSVLKLVASTSRVPPSEANGIAITTAGNVGIGTTAPAAKLHVAGNAAQTLSGRGFAKAMVNIDTDASSGVSFIKDCYNGINGETYSQPPGGTATTCGFSVRDGGTTGDGTHITIITFPFSIRNCFFSLTLIGGNHDAGSVSVTSDFTLSVYAGYEDYHLLVF